MFASVYTEQKAILNVFIKIKIILILKYLNSNFEYVLSMLPTPSDDYLSALYMVIQFSARYEE